MKIEFLLALFGNLKCLSSLLACLFGCGVFVYFVIGLITFIEDYSRDKSEPFFDKTKKKVLLYCVLIELPLLGLFVTPSIEELWKVRISLIKLQLASPENISKGVDEITRIGKRLEERYLGKGPVKDEP